MKDNLKFTLVVIGIFGVFFIMGREIIETRAKLKNTQDQVALEKKEKARFQYELRAANDELARTGRDLRACEGKLDFVNKKIAALRSDNATLIRAKQGLEYRIVLLKEEKRITEAKLRSLSELKKAIREIRIGMREEKIKQQRESDRWETALGNHGFFVKDGEAFYKSKVNVRVRPANLSLNKK